MRSSGPVSSGEYRVSAVIMRSNGGPTVESEACGCRREADGEAMQVPSVHDHCSGGTVQSRVRTCMAPCSSGRFARLRLMLLARTEDMTSGRSVATTSQPIELSTRLGRAVNAGVDAGE